MTTPAIAADFWLDRADLDEIEKAVDLMLDRLSKNKAPTDGIPMPSVHGRQIFAAGTSNTIRPRDVEGSYNRQTKNITLDPFPGSSDMSAGRGAGLADDLMVFRFALRSLLAHEISHLRQDEQSKGDLDSEFSAAENASKRAEHTKDYSDYLLYLQCPVEIAAHATQLAVEVLDSYGRSLTESEFTRRCRQAWVFRRARKGEKWQTGDEQARIQAFMPVAETWIGHAHFAYQRLLL